jgi:hypothetical protein
MKKILVLSLYLLFSLGAFAGSWVTFWTQNKKYGKIDVYYNDQYAGTITHAYTSPPSCGAPGCVTVWVEGSGNTWYAEAEDGSRWTSSRVTLSGECTRMRLYGSPNYKSPSSTTSSSSGSSSSSGYSGSGYNPDTDAALAAVAVAATAVVLFAVSNEMYLSKAESKLYNGYTFGLKQTTNPYIDVEYGGSIYTQKPGFLTSRFLKTDPLPFARNDKRIWSLDFAAVYNFRNKWYGDGPGINPYIGFGVSGLFYPWYGDSKSRAAFILGGIAGLSLGCSENFKIHLRYRRQHAFERDFLPVNQIEMGFSLKYH